MSTDSPADPNATEGHDEGINYWFILGLFAFGTLAFYITMLLSVL